MIFDPDTGNLASFRFDEKDNSSLASDNVEDVLCDIFGNVWLACNGGG